jgi:hypothetical protein
MKKLTITTTEEMYEHAVNGFAGQGWTEASGISREEWMQQRILDMLITVGASHAREAAQKIALAQVEPAVQAAETRARAETTFTVETVSGVE